MSFEEERSGVSKQGEGKLFPEDSQSNSKLDQSSSLSVVSRKKFCRVSSTEKAVQASGLCVLVQVQYKCSVCNDACIVDDDDDDPTFHCVFHCGEQCLPACISFLLCLFVFLFLLLHLLLLSAVISPVVLSLLNCLITSFTYRRFLSPTACLLNYLRSLSFSFLRDSKSRPLRALIILVQPPPPPPPILSRLRIKCA